MSYSPKVKIELIKRLHRVKLSKSEKKPLTYYVNEAIEQYLIQNEKMLPDAPEQREGVEKGKAE